MRLITKLAVGLVALAGILLPATAATAQETTAPYRVSAEGILLVNGTNFPDGGHVNIHTTAPHTDLHFEAKCIERTDAECAGALHDAAQYIGKNFIPWSAFGLGAGDCITWVQVADYNYHFGAQEEEPVCIPLPPTEPPTTTPPTTEPPTTTPPTTEPPVVVPPATEPPVTETPTPETTHPPVHTGEDLTPLNIDTMGDEQERLADTGDKDILALIIGSVFCVIVGAAIFGLSIDKRRRVA